MTTELKNTEIVKQESAAPALFNKKPKALEVLASRLNLDPAKLMATLKATVFKGCTDEEMMMMVAVANEYGLNPFLKELYAFPKKGGGIVAMVPIDGWIKLINRADNFDGIEFEYNDGPDGKPISCTAVISIKNRSKPVRVTEYFSECYRQTDPWNMMPRRMMRHKALMQGGRVAFGVSGITDEDESQAELDHKRLEMAKPVYDTTEPITGAEAIAKIKADAEAAEKLQASEAAKAPTEGDKTRRINKVCQENNVDIGKALSYFGEMGHSNFEEVPDRVLEMIEKRPAQFVSSVRGGK